MSSKSEKDRAKQIQDRCQNILIQMLKDEDNKYCVDCDAKGPRWASWNLGIFLCIRCAGIHRNLGVHISKVKSVNLDSWTPEQVVSLQQMGNSRARAVYEANLPDSFRRPQNDSSLEAFIRAKYETKKYIAKEWVPPTLPKVNWDKEIDEEMERQKRKKKSTSSSSSGVGALPAPSAADNKYNKSDVIPSLPKPKSSVSPKLGRSIPGSAQPVEAAKPTNGAADLLGLDTSRPETKPAGNDDIFSSFFSAPQETPAETKPEETKPDLKTEEQNFFNQAAPTEKEKSKLTKDSILALYSQTPSTNLTNQFSGQNYQFNPTFQGAYSNVPVQNGMQAQLNQYQPVSAQFQQQFTPVSQPFQQAVSQPFQQAVSQPFQQAVSQPFQQAVSQNFPQNNQQIFAQPAQAQPLAQQFGSMNINQAFPSSFPQQQNTNLTGNLTWQ